MILKYLHEKSRMYIKLFDLTDSESGLWSETESKKYKIISEVQSFQATPICFY
jgi:hypothetical protein